MRLDTPLSALNGVGKTRYAQLQKLGLNTVGDLLYFFPRAYENRSDVHELTDAPLDVPTATVLTVATPVKSAALKRGLTLSKFKAFDDSGAADVVFFNSPFVKDVFTVGATFRFWGKLTLSKNHLQLSNPKYEPVIESRPLPDFVPVYPLTEGITSKFIDKLVISVLDEAIGEIEETLPERTLKKYGLLGIKEAIFKAHVPKSETDLSDALRRLAFDEMLIFGLGISMRAQNRRRSVGIKLPPCSIAPLLSLIPYELTASQKKAVNDIYADMVIGGKDNFPAMSRIVVGDVGSGKTVCATIALYICAMGGAQGALMVPTEILAKQHYAEISALFSRLGIAVELLLGSTTQKEKKRIYSSLESGETSVVIGTHALLSEKVAFKNLALIITDEQHRFGVLQRSVLKERSEHAHMLVMSATPIPRTLALTMYGDLDVSRITELPRGRQVIDTFVVDESYRARLCDFMQKQISAGGQCYVICPSIEPEEEGTFVPMSISSPFCEERKTPLKNVIEHTALLSKLMPNVRVAYLHGKMKNAEKSEIMNKFAAGNIDVLVSTTVIEVGINVPNASLMIVENAERFGLSQLHQLRGRVGRGTRKSYCVLVSDNKSEKTTERLQVLKSTRDGFEIAEKDLALRGPGDVFLQNSNDIMRQSGGFDFRFAKLCDDGALVENAFSEAKSIVVSDPELAFPEHALLSAKLSQITDESAALIS